MYTRHGRRSAFGMWLMSPVRMASYSAFSFSRRRSLAALALALRSLGTSWASLRFGVACPLPVVGSGLAALADSSTGTCASSCFLNGFHVMLAGYGDV